MISLTQKSKEYLQSLLKGYEVDRCECWIERIKKRKDLFHMFDLVAVSGLMSGVLGVQSTSSSNMSARIHKIMEDNEHIAKVWITAGNRIQVHGWKKLTKSKDGKFWHVRIAEINLTNGDLTSEIVT